MYPATVRVLLDAGAEVEHYAATSRITPVIYAGGRIRLDLVKLLVARGADVYRTAARMIVEAGVMTEREMAG